jgi:hypothetical protein
MVIVLPIIKVSSSVPRSANARANTMTAVIKLGSSSEDGDRKDNVNDNDNKNGNGDTHMCGTDSGDHAPRLSRRFHAPIGRNTC